MTTPKQRKERRPPVPDLDPKAQAEELWRSSREAQGLPLVVEDDRTLDRVAAIVRSARDDKRKRKP